MTTTTPDQCSNEDAQVSAIGVHTLVIEDSV
jgi:hypothetical protein